MERKEGRKKRARLSGRESRKRYADPEDRGKGVKKVRSITGKSTINTQERGKRRTGNWEAPGDR